MSIFKDTRTLAAKVVEMVGRSKGRAPVNDTKPITMASDCPSFLCEPVYADINNYRELLIDSGYTGYCRSELPLIRYWTGNRNNTDTYLQNDKVLLAKVIFYR